MAESNNTIGNKRFNDVDVKPPLNLPKGSPLETSLAKNKEDFFKKNQAEREAVGKDVIGSLTGTKTTVITEEAGKSVRFRQVKNGILKETDKVNSGDEVTLMGRYLMHEINGSNHGLLKVQLADGREGYIAATHLSSIGGTPEPAPAPGPAPAPKPKPTPTPAPGPAPAPKPTPGPEAIPTGNGAEWMKKHTIGANLSQTFKDSQDATYGDLTLNDILDKLQLEDATDETYKKNLILLKKEAEKIKNVLINTKDKGVHKYELTNILATKLKDAQNGNIVISPKPQPAPAPAPAPAPVPVPAPAPGPVPKPAPAPGPGEGPRPSPDYPIGNSGKPLARLTTIPDRVTSPYPPHHNLDVKNISAGLVVKDPHTGGLFEVPVSPKTNPEPEKPRGIMFYTVKRNDTIGTIATQHHITEEVFRKMNKLGPRDTIKPGDTVVVPTTGEPIAPTQPQKIPAKPQSPEVKQGTDWEHQAKWILDTWGFGGGHALHIGPKFRASSGKTLGDLTIKDIEGFSKALEGSFPSIKKDASELEKKWLDKKTAELGGGSLSPVEKNKVKDMSIYEIQKEITP